MMKRFSRLEKVVIFSEDYLEERKKAISKFVEKDIIINVPVIALTFDDGPSEYTHGILDVLESYYIKANFFPVAAHILENDHRVARMVAGGHLIGNHSYSHPDFREINRDKQVQEIENANRIIAGYAGKSPKIFRPPGGGYNEDLCLILKELEMIMVMWSFDTYDWLKNKEEIIAGAHLVPGGVIVLLHELKQTLEALPAFLAILLAKKYTFAKVD